MTEQEQHQKAIMDEANRMNLEVHSIINGQPLESVVIMLMNNIINLGTMAETDAESLSFVEAVCSDMRAESERRFKRVPFSPFEGEAASLADIMVLDQKE